MEDEKVKKEHEEFEDLLNALFDKIGYYGQIEDIIARALDYKITEVVVDMIIAHEKEYHPMDRAKKGFN